MQGTLLVHVTAISRLAILNIVDNVVFYVLVLLRWTY